MDVEEDAVVDEPLEDMLDDPRNIGGDQAEVIHHDLYSAANVITMLRLFLIPFFFSALLSDASNSDTLAFILFAVASGTDWLDGMIARRTGTVTAVGRMIDPLVDRLLIAAAVIGLNIVGRLPLWIVVVLVLRDVYLLYGSWKLERYNMRLAVTQLGKLTTVVLLVAFASLIWGYPIVEMPGLGEGVLGSHLVYVGLVLSLSAAVQYTFRAKRVVDKLKDV